MKLPYGIADFYHLRTAGYEYVDRTGAIRTVEERGETLLFLRIKSFVSDYRDHLPEPVTIEADAFHTLDGLLAVIRQTPYRLYLLVDEYDNFANEVMASDPQTYDDLVHTDGPFKYLFKWVKGVMAGKGLERITSAC